MDELIAADIPVDCMESPPCDLCGSTERQVLYKIGDWRYRRPEPEYGVCRCRNCGLTYLSPRPTASTVGRHYPTTYDNGRGRTNPATQNRYLTQAEFVGSGPGSLLDVGTARGDFVEVMQEHGWDALGVEPFSRDSDSSQRVIHGSLEDLLDRGLSFDVVTAWHVLEHMHSPTKVLRLVSQLLRPGGRFMVSVPNFDSYWARWLKGEDIPRHLHFFDPITLRRIGEVAGFNIGRRSFDLGFSSGGAAGRGSFDRWAYCVFGGLSLYEYLVIVSDPDRSLRQECPTVHQLCRPIQYLERWLLTAQRLERSGKGGVMAFEFLKPA